MIVFADQYLELVMVKSLCDNLVEKPPFAAAVVVVVMENSCCYDDDLGYKEYKLVFLAQ